MKEMTNRDLSKLSKEELLRIVIDVRSVFAKDFKYRRDVDDSPHFTLGWIKQSVGIFKMYDK